MIVCRNQHNTIEIEKIAIEHSANLFEKKIQNKVIVGMKSHDRGLKCADCESIDD